MEKNKMLKLIFNLHNVHHQVCLVNLEEFDYQSEIGNKLYKLMEDLEKTCEVNILTHPESIENYEEFRNDFNNLIRKKISEVKESIEKMEDNELALEILDGLSNGIEEEIRVLPE